MLKLDGTKNKNKLGANAILGAHDMEAAIAGVAAISASAPATIQSRCQRFDFRNIAATKIAGHLKDVLAKESIAADDAAVMQVARLANGSMRDGLSLLDRLVAASGDGRITAQLLSEVLGMPDASVVAALVSAIGTGDARSALEHCAALLEGGTLTAIRTAATTALATDALARRDARRLLIVGTGEEAWYHARALAQVRQLTFCAS